MPAVAAAGLGGSIVLFGGAVGSAFATGAGTVSANASERGEPLFALPGLFETGLTGSAGAAAVTGVGGCCTTGVGAGVGIGCEYIFGFGRVWMARDKWDV